MSQFASETILDYASPMQRTPLRLATKSLISAMPEGDSIVILETLAGQAQALAAIIFSSITVTMLGIAVMASDAPQSLVDLLNPALLVYFLFAGGTAVLILAVIHTNWRQTIVRASPDWLTLMFSSPLIGRAYDWPSDRVRHVHVVQTLDPRSRQVVFDLQIELNSGPRLQLFSGHESVELSDFASAIRSRVFITEKMNHR